MSSSLSSFSDAIAVIEGYHTKDPNVQEAQHIIEEQLKNAAENDHEKRGDCYYLLLRLLFKGHIPFENPVAKTYYEHMTEHFTTQEQHYKLEIMHEEDDRKRSIKVSQLKAFYKLMERYYATLESLYTHNGFVEAKDRSYYQKMIFRKNRFLLEHEFLKYLGYSILQSTTKFGLSIQRWMITVMLSIFIFSILFYLVDITATAKLIPGETRFGFDYIYYSILNFTTLGSPEFAAHTLVQRFLSGAEVLIGYTMLGMFVNILFKRF
ncbi:MAG: potassium channel family protein [Candidatus Gracilibacteria bacterium]